MAHLAPSLAGLLAVFALAIRSAVCSGAISDEEQAVGSR